jgi:hypothetical protein
VLIGAPEYAAIDDEHAVSESAAVAAIAKNTLCRTADLALTFSRPPASRIRERSLAPYD